MILRFNVGVQLFLGHFGQTVLLGKGLHILKMLIDVVPVVGEHLRLIIVLLFERLVRLVRVVIIRLESLFSQVSVAAQLLHAVEPGALSRVTGIGELLLQHQYRLTVRLQKNLDKILVADVQHEVAEQLAGIVPCRCS